MRFEGQVRPAVAGTLRVLERVLLPGGRRTALENARAAVLADRERAAARFEAERALRSVLGPAPRPEQAQVPARRP
ncbi:hypothetical protein [Streptomyces hoynatensis]|uniref:Uncharacterized protein n=1 Tax=Streptomyces hoynatensis TaxID=1141874 RepID=A0A3A9Z1X7_9ACTN|nr:hypothetical protein [Streptomyces hoynatensis]RKN42225.1 hypothetical protein D7294_12290 [Streptomyces hoynatensis]